MKKISFFLANIILFSIILTSFSVNNIYAEDNQIRVGLEQGFKNVSQLKLANTTITVGSEGYNPYPLSSQNGFTIKKISGIFIQLNEVFDYSQAQTYFNKSYGSYMAYPVLIENGKYHIYIGSFNSIPEAQSYISQANLNGIVVSSSQNSLGIYSGDKLDIIYNSIQKPQISTYNYEPIKLGEKQYRGKLEIINNSGSLTAVNVLSMEEYLYSVVASEMPSSWAKEALKAQAVASRSYSYSKQGAHSSSGYDLCDSTHCQLYTGISGEAESVREAVDETKAIMAYYNSIAINGVFSSSNGGYSADSKSVWNYDCPYLVAVEDSQELGGKVWQRTFNFSDIANAVGNIGAVQSISIEKDSTSGRVNKMIIKGSSGEKILERENIRTFFSALGGSLESRNFNIAQSTSTNLGSTTSAISVVSKDGVSSLGNSVTASSSSSTESISLQGSYTINSTNAKTPLSLITITNSAPLAQTISGTTTVTFSGKGWGHGVGMSQYGAKTMAENGATYDQILKHYYTGIEIK